MNEPALNSPTPNVYLPCPKCHSTNVKLMGFTWWGGLVGPKILTHVKCGNCGATFNGKTGKPNTTAIAIYMVVVLVVVIGLVVALKML